MLVELLAAITNAWLFCEPDKAQLTNVTPKIAFSRFAHLLFVESCQDTN